MGEICDKCGKRSANCFYCQYCWENLLAEVRKLKEKLRRKDEKRKR